MTSDPDFKATIFSASNYSKMVQGRAMFTMANQ